MYRPKAVSDRPQAVLALTDSAYAESLAGHLHTAGWQVHLAESAAGARKLTAKLSPAVVVLSTARPDESGYLTCAKIQKGRKKVRVLLLADEASNGKREFAAYVGASDCLASSIGPRAVAARVLSLMPAVA